jgi:putative ABC transport system permease protein
MSWKRLFRRKQWDEERARELEAYLENETLDNIARGMSEADARYAAQRKLGNTNLIREEIYEMNSIAIVETLSRDLRHAWRGLWKNPGFTLAVVAVLALGIGANTAIFSIVNTVLLRPLPFAESDRMVRIMHVPPQTMFPGMKVFAVSPANYLDWKSSSRSFDSMAAYQVRSASLTGHDQAEAVRVASVGPEFFQVVRTAPEQGRTPAASDRPGAPLEVVVSHSFWVSHLASSPAAIGQTLTLSRDPYTIVGVMPASFEFTAWGATSVQLWRTLIWDDAERAVRGNHNYMVVARLKPGVSVKAAGAELDAISTRLEKEYPKDNTGWGATITTLQETIVGNIRQMLWVLLGAVGFVLLIASANVANLILGRAVTRRKEMAVRAALGATRGQILQHVLTESLLLSFAGGAAGLLLAFLLMPAARAMLENQLPRANEIALDPSVLMFTLAISIFSGLLAGAAPALRASRVDLNDSLKQGGRGDARASGGRTRGVLVVSEVALSFMLLMGAGLMIRSLWALRHVNTGIDPHNVISMSIFIPEKKYPEASQQIAFFQETLRHTRALPGIQSAALIDNLPLQGGSMQPVTFEGRPAAASMSEQPEVATRRASPGYLTTMRIPLLMGRDFSESDGAAVLISQSMAKEFWPNENPIGRHMKFTFAPENNWEVIGVVGDVKTGDLTESPRATAYQCSNRLKGAFMQIVARTSGDPEAFAKSITGAIHEIDNEQPVQNVQSMDELITSTLTSERLSAILLGVFAALAVALAGVGIYGVLSYAVRSRTREIGIRTALGANVRDIVSLVLIEGMKPACLGIVVGVAGALSLTSVMTRLVYGVSPADPATFAAVSILFVTVSMLASTLPAYRASKVDPLTTLRDE